MATLASLRESVCDGSTHMTGRLLGVGDVLIGYAWHDFGPECECLDMSCAWTRRDSAAPA